MANKKVKDTLFIDMKYVILYQKLGYKEYKPDFFIAYYDDIKVIIESEECRFLFNDGYYPLLTYDDFVLLECLDRLLKMGYKTKDLDIINHTINIRNNEDIFLTIHMNKWEEKFPEYIDATDLTCLYSSQLSGGIVEYKYSIYKNMQNYSAEFHNKLYTISEINVKTIQHSKDFIIEQTQLIKYTGFEEEVEIPHGITYIAAGAFSGNLALKKVHLPNSVQIIGGDAFIYCENLEEINIPPSVKQIGDDPFAGCKAINIINNSPYFCIEDSVLFDKNKKTLIHYPMQSTLEEYAIPSEVEWIGKHSFYKCTKLKKVVIPENVSYIGNNPFSECKNIVLLNTSPYFHYINGVLYNKEKTNCLHYSMGSNVEHVILEPTLRKIGRNSFWNCSMIRKITIPQSVREIGYNPFAGCSNIIFDNQNSNFIVEDGILYDADCKELIACSFSGINNGTANIKTSTINIGRRAFAKCDALKFIAIPEGIEYISKSAFSSCKYLENVILPDSLKEIGDSAFSSCTKLLHIKIPKNVKIGYNVFAQSTIIEKV